MWISPLFWGFKGQSPVCPAVTGWIASIISFAFFLWTMIIDAFFRKDSENALLTIIFIISIVILILFIIVLAISILKKILVVNQEKYCA